MDLTKKKETLFINLSSSYCGNCGKGCLPEEKSHEYVASYSEEERSKKGCGVVWKYVDSDYRGLEMRKNIGKMRPDLINLSTDF